MTLFFASIAVGLIIVAVVVGYPYWRTHHRMREPYDKTEAHGYLDAKERADEGVLPDQPGRPEKQVVAATHPVGVPRSADAQPAEQQEVEPQAGEG